MTAPSRDDFESWKAHPVTEFVMDGLRKLSAKQIQTYKDAAWGMADDQSQWDDLRLTWARCKARAEAYSDLADVSVEDAYGANGLEPPPPEKEPA